MWLATAIALLSNVYRAERRTAYAERRALPTRCRAPIIPWRVLLQDQGDLLLGELRLPHRRAPLSATRIRRRSSHIGWSSLPGSAQVIGATRESRWSGALGEQV
jgi:hypothetical protein